MSDTSGFGGFGPSTRKIRHQIELTFAEVIVKYGPTAREKRGKKLVTTQGDGAALLANVVWQQLESDHLLEEVLLPSEIPYYLEAMARFIYGAKRGGLQPVVEEFELRDESKFPSLRRYISSRAPGNSESGDNGSEQHSRAGGAFNAGSARWAQEISGVTDPTQIAIRLLVDLVRSKDRYEEALLLSARRILQEYGERVLRGFIREDDPWRTKATPALIAAFHAQLDQFFADHSSAAEWEPRRIATTLQALPVFVRD